MQPARMDLDPRHEAELGADTECPMEDMCRRTIQRAPFGVAFSIVGIALLVGGVLVLVEPAFLRGLLASTSIVLGVLMLIAAFVLARLAERLRERS